MMLQQPRRAATSPAYQEALDWLYGFLNSEKKLPATRAEFNLPRTAALLQALDNPQQRFASVVVAGTKGKGSTCAMLESILRAAGLKTGLYSSPHLHSFRERVQLGRVPLTQQQLVDLTPPLREAVARLAPDMAQPSVFELTTALALLWFAREQVDCAVLEVGLGGRYDSVNVVTPLLSVITPISYDHMAILGDTLSAIAFEKAGIIKPGVPVLTAPQHPEAAAVLERVAREQGAPLQVAREQGLLDLSGPGAPTPGPERPYPLSIDPATVGLRGAFQVENARLACGAALLLRSAGLPLSDEAIAAGLASVSWPARLEVVHEQPLVVVDGAQNGASAERLAEALRALFRFERLVLVLGASADKDLEAIAAALVPLADGVVLTRSEHPRAAPLEALRAAAAPYLRGELLETESMRLALERALLLAGPGDLICVTGSLFVAAEGRELFGRGERD